MRLFGAGVCAGAIALMIGCHRGSASSEGTPPAPGAPPAASGPEGSPAGTDPNGSPAAHAELTCAERAYTFPVGPDVDGLVPCSGELCVESAPASMGDAFLAGQRGALWAIGVPEAWYVRAFLRQQGDRWVSTCPPPGAWDVTAVYGARGDDVWIGGPHGYVAHWDGRAWTETRSPVDARVSALWGDGHDAFASVDDLPGGPASHGPLLHWDGSAWHDTGAIGIRPWGDGRGRAWAVSGDGVLEWNGETWVALGGLPADFVARDVWAPDGGEPWILGHRMTVPPPPPASGSYGFTAAVLRRDAGAFVDLALPSRDGAAASWIRGASPSDVRVATFPRYMHDLSVAFRWDGECWSMNDGTTWPIPEPHVLADGEALVWEGNGVLGAPVFRTLDGAPGEPRIDPGRIDVMLAATSGQGDVWLAGYSGLWRLDGSAFRVIADEPSSFIQLDARAPDDVWAETGGGDVLHWNGTAVERIDAPIPYPYGVIGVASAGGGRGWAIASQYDGHVFDCSLWRWDGAWSTEAMPAAACPMRIASGPDGDLWLAVGGEMWRRTADGAWDRFALPAQHLDVIVARGRTDVWAAGDGIYHYDGAGWRQVGELLVQLAFSASAPDDAWAVGSEQRTGDWGLWHWDGSAWMEWPTELLPFGVAALSGGELWGAAGGSVLHRRAPHALTR